MSRFGWGAACGPLAGVVFFGGLSSAHAQSEPLAPVHVTYSADRTCPTAEAFLGKVRRYTTKWTLAEGPAARRFRVVLAPVRAAGRLETSGRLEIEEQANPPSVRDIVGPDCEAVARALAIALAVVIDPQADLSGGATDDSQKAAGEGDSAGDGVSRASAPTAPPEVVSSDHTSLATPTPSPLPPREAPRPPLSVEPTAATRLRAEALVGATSAVVDGALLVLGATVELEPFADRRVNGAPSAFPRWLSPSIALGFRQSLPREFEQSGMTSQFLWTAGTLQLCPLRWSAFRERLALTPCFESNAGVLIASARGSHDSRSSTKRWLDLGGTAKATWRVHGAWFVGGTFSVVAPVTRYQFELSTQAAVSQAPPVGFAFGAIAGLGF
ncbi:hypothetical protein AKJ09_10952 [Labilithrix luteola]|uniref:Uncharacterized protein n=1 Tax=Labilithrix luteola TaxID=1391654 RepID=A0A0K1QEV5_9BACT|nr:hypothetical protein [Labilithrix luteola]AKV04289.1 hypothetical protein AKJ09_10952 [Labilithrix luteola]